MIFPLNLMKSIFLKPSNRIQTNETVTNCNGLKMPAADGKMRLTDVADTEPIVTG